jgi:hypothetical protein
LSHVETPTNWWKGKEKKEKLSWGTQQALNIYSALAKISFPGTLFDAGTSASHPTGVTQPQPPLAFRAFSYFVILLMQKVESTFILFYRYV